MSRVKTSNFENKFPIWYNLFKMNKKEIKNATAEKIRKI